MVAPAETEPSSVRVQEVSKSFPLPDDPLTRREALSNISLSLAPGELVSLIGPSGCGKSTLLRLIAGLDTPDSGELLVGSDPINEPSAERGLVFQDPNLFPWLTVRRNIEAGLVARRVLREKRNEVDEFMARRTRGLCRCLSASSLGRHVAARRSCPRADQPSESASAGRTTRRARRVHAHAPAG